MCGGVHQKYSLVVFYTTKFSELFVSVSYRSSGAGRRYIQYFYWGFKRKI